MNVFPDPSFLGALYRQQVQSEKAIEFMGNLGGPLPLSGLVLLEFRHSTRLQVRLFSKDPSKGFSQREASRMFLDLQRDIENDILRIQPVDWWVVHQLAENFSETHRRFKSHRLMDILHVATAKHLGAWNFLTFDENQKLLARAEGLQVPL
jgi:predicted nucleic acid-binding protein